MGILIRAIFAVALLSPTVSWQKAFADNSEDVQISPKDPWDDNYESEDSSGSWGRKILLWVPNRALDFIDIFRADLGFGLAYGGVVRASKSLQAGYRKIDTSSFRIGTFGRYEKPFLEETGKEYGVGPFFKNETGREVCPGEVGLGADLVLAGAYGGICVEEVLDFFAGLVFLDVTDDDLE